MHRHLCNTVDFLWLRQASSFQDGGYDVGTVSELAAQAAFVLDAFWPANDHWVADAAEMRGHLLSPFKWGKQVASHLGGIRNPMVISWPKRIKDKGGLRSQFTHCTDIAPTILEAAGLPEPKEVNGVAQMPMHGVSFLSTFDDANAPSRHTQQYFAILGNRAMYKDGWIACWRLDRIHWKIDPQTLARFAPGKW